MDLSERPSPLTAERPGHIWCYDFQEDGLLGGRKARLLNVLDEFTFNSFTRERLSVTVGTSLTSRGVISALGALFSEVESFHSRLRDEMLDREAFAAVREARARLEAHRAWYNECRPHSGLGYLPPAAFARRWREIQQDIISKTYY